jgi:hypothetical protein
LSISNGGPRQGLYEVMVKVVALDALPPAVVTATFPVFAPVGTVAFTCVLETIVKLVAWTPPNVTAVVCARLCPVMTTEVPIEPLAGVKLLI